MAVSGGAVAAGAAGIILFYAAVSGRSVLASVRDVVQGKKLPAVPSATPGGTAGTPSTYVPGQAADQTSGQLAANQNLGRLLAAGYGWASGPEWDALNAIAGEESGWNAYAANPTSDARGIAQNINGWSASYQPGNASQQISWMLAYIKSRYGDPIAAQNFHLANGWY